MRTSVSIACCMVFQRQADRRKLVSTWSGSRSGDASGRCGKSGGGEKIEAFEKKKWGMKLRLRSAKIVRILLTMNQSFFSAASILRSGSLPGLLLLRPART